MAQTIYGDLNVKRTIDADRRVNQGMSVETITGDRAVTIHDFAWLQLTNATTQSVILPDASTLATGWSIVVCADSASGASVDVMTYDSSTPVLLKNVLVARAYRFTLLSIGTPAGVWHIDFLEEADTLPSARYVSGFDATTSWGSPSAGYYTFTCTQASHLRGVNPMVQLFLGPSPFTFVAADQMTVAANGNVAIRVTQVPDLRFAGQLILV